MNENISDKLVRELREFIHNKTDYETKERIEFVYSSGANYTFTFTDTKNEEYIIKLGTRKLKKGIEQERLFLSQKISEIILAKTNVMVPEITFVEYGKWKFDKHIVYNYSIAKKINGKTLDTVWDEFDIETKKNVATQLGKWLKQIHSIQIDSVVEDNEFEQIKKHYSNWNDLLIKRLKRAIKIIKKEETLDPELVEKAFQFVLTTKLFWSYKEKGKLVHNDLWSGNILVIENNTNEWTVIGLLNWEWAVFGDPFFDLTYYEESLFYNEEEAINVFNISYDFKPEDKEVQRKKGIFNIVQAVTKAAYGHLHENPSEEEVKRIEEIIQNCLKNSN